MDKKTTTYRYSTNVGGRPAQKDLYEGECHVIYAGRSPDNFGVRREPTFWHNGIAYTIERTHKLAIDRPTITIAIPTEMLRIASATPAAADFCLRAVKPYFEAINEGYANRSRPDKENGKFYIYEPGPQVLLRNAAYFAMHPAKDYEELRCNEIFVNPDISPPDDIFCLHIRMEVQLPHKWLDRAITMLCKQMPNAAERFVNEFDVLALEDVLKLEKMQKGIREFLKTSDYCAFIANGSILARERGSDRPDSTAIPFKSPAEHEIEAAGFKGIGIKRGVTVITGGGYSGKSTVLNAISAGIYNHIAGDGRELCITDDSAVTITAEDGRAVSSVNISPFIKWIPGSNPGDFSTTHASGSTSQAANIMEAVSFGSKLLLIDEDRSATNFMIRDAVMKKLIEKEPITPFTDRVRELCSKGTSTILVIGGSGEYLSVADNIFMMDEFIMSEVTETAKALVQAAQMPCDCANWSNIRSITEKFSSYPTGAGRERLSVTDTGFIAIGDERIDIRSLHDIATPAQVNALAFILRYLAKSSAGLSELEALALAMRGLSPKKGSADSETDIAAEVNELIAQINQNSLNVVDSGFFTTMERFMDVPRAFEVLAAINRMRHVEWKNKS